MKNKFLYILPFLFTLPALGDISLHSKDDKRMFDQTRIGYEFIGLINKVEIDYDSKSVLVLIKADPLAGRYKFVRVRFDGDDFTSGHLLMGAIDKKVNLVMKQEGRISSMVFIK